jgi:DNA gyrase/topoisomerase IV subunit A
VQYRDELMLITASGMIIRTGLDEIRSIGRNTQGVRLIKLKPGDKLVAAEKIAYENANNRKEKSSNNQEPKTEAKPEPKAKAEPEPKPKAKPKPKTKTKAKPKAKPKPKSTSKRPKSKKAKRRR